MFSVVLLAVVFAFVGGVFLRISDQTSLQEDTSDLEQSINQLLPQTQCESCGYPGCQPYAAAIIRGDAEINQCAPGGNQTIKQLADLLGKETLPFNKAFGEYRPFRVALVREDECIGCTKCIQACPVDAIVGAAKTMHTVIETYCTGCELCLPPCPVDCIDMVSQR